MLNKPSPMILNCPCSHLSIQAVVAEGPNLKKGTQDTFEAEWGIFGPTDFNRSAWKNVCPMTFSGASERVYGA